MGRMSGKVVLITGAGSGVGRAAMELFAREGADVVGVARTQANLESSLERVREAGGRGSIIAADLSVDASCQEVVRETLERHGRIDSLVHAAGVGYSWMDKSPGSMGDVLNTTPEAWQEVIAINLNACFYMCRHVIPEFVRQGRGSIVNVSSISGYMGLASAHTYTAAKAGMINLTRSLCVAYAAQGVRANCIAPGFIDTPMVASVLHIFDDPAVAERITPMRRPGTAMEMAYGCLYLASDESSYCNGTVLTIDGGTTSRQ
ncbi:MAG: family oxidoreductase [Panacagrimonas sp.]|jgi:NAD(P)-dependent dehydrogenase (short-subunit alcohol dehydrogenase family)|nr:SDR family NAD(P)-dependent oxidoreductase [Panacagrimonas sp.]MCC2658822.1 family oxidoreductase [Panacagrimonas sp.]